VTDEQRTIGRLEAQVDRLRADVAALDSKLDAITSLVQQAQGARWAVGVIGAISGAAASAGVWVLSVVRGE
jgi:hypothetical protein